MRNDTLRMKHSANKSVQNFNRKMGVRKGWGGGEAAKAHNYLPFCTNAQVKFCELTFSWHFPLWARLRDLIWLEWHTCKSRAKKTLKMCDTCESRPPTVRAVFATCQRCQNGWQLLIKSPSYPFLYLNITNCIQKSQIIFIRLFYANTLSKTLYLLISIYTIEEVWNLATSQVRRTVLPTSPLHDRNAQFKSVIF